MLQIHISDTIMYSLAEMNVSSMYSIFDTKLTCLVVYDTGTGFPTKSVYGTGTGITFIISTESGTGTIAIL